MLKLESFVVITIAFIAVIVATLLLPAQIYFLNIPDIYLQDLARDHANRSAKNDTIYVIKITEESVGRLTYTEPYDRLELSDTVSMLKKANIQALGVDIIFDRPTDGQKDKMLQEELKQLTNSGIPVVLARLPEGNSTFLNEWIRNTGALSGHVGLTKDQFGVVRSMPQNMEDSFTSALAKATGETNSLPNDAEIVYRLSHDNDPFSTIEIQHLEHSTEHHNKWFEGKIILIGADRTYVDRHQVPYAGYQETGKLAGIFIHAHILDQLLGGRLQKQLSTEYQIVAISIIAVVGMLLAYWPVGILIKLAAGTGVVGLILVGGFIFIMQGNVLVPMIWPALTFLTSWGIVTAYLSQQYSGEKKYIKSAFSSYIDPTWVEHLVRSRGSVERDGKLCTLTFLFTDVENFTNYSETQTPEHLVEKLNVYLDGVSNCIIENGGTIDKYIGDAVVAFFGAPLERTDHAKRAIKCALEITQFAKTFEDRFNTHSAKFGRTRIGVHTGQAIVGNIGGTARINYTAIGDTVNTASRLEGSNKKFGTQICVSNHTRSQCTDQLFRPIGHLLLKGKTELVEAFEPLNSNRENNLLEYQAAYEYLEGDPQEALKLFQTLANEFPDDPLIEFHVQRLERGEIGKEIVLGEK